MAAAASAAAAAAAAADAEPVPACWHCGTHRTDSWRHHAGTGNRICHCCSKYAKTHDGELPPADVLLQRQQQRQLLDQERAEGQRRCSHCDSSSSQAWRRHPQMRQRLCGACGRYMDKHGGELPPPQVLQQQQLRQQQRQQEAADARAGQRRRCGHCGWSGGGKREPQWRRHAATQMLLCINCHRHSQQHGGTLPPLTGATQLRQLKAAEQEQGGKQCHHCKVSDSKPWRLDLHTGERLCNACRGYQESHSGQLPPPEVVAKRQRLKAQRQAEAEQGVLPASLRCSVCGSGSSPSGWLLNPAPGSSGRVCGPCANYWRLYQRWPPEETLARRHQRQAEKQQGERACSHCGSGDSAGLWRRHPETLQRLCNTCCRCLETRGELPSGEAVLLRMQRRQQVQQEQQEQPGIKQCSHCGSTRPHGDWLRHQATQKRLCHPCGAYSRAADGELPPPAVLRQREERQQQQRPEEEEEDGRARVRCSHCDCTETTSWRRHPETGERLCSGCKQYILKHGELPAEQVLRRRRQLDRKRKRAAAGEGDDPQEQSDSGDEEAVQPCLRCGTTSAGEGAFSCWRRCPLTGERRLCQACYCRAFAAKLQAEQQPQQQQPQQQAGERRQKRRRQQDSEQLQQHRQGRLRQRKQPQPLSLQQQQQGDKPRRKQPHRCSQPQRQQQEMEQPAPHTMQQQQRELEQQRQLPHRAQQQQQAVIPAAAGAAVPVRRKCGRKPQPGKKQCACCNVGDGGARQWRLWTATGERLCAACYQYAERHGGQWPPASVLEKRQRRQQGSERARMLPPAAM